MNASPQVPKGDAHPLVVRFGALGDMVMLTALLETLSAQWGRPCDLIAGGGLPPLVMQELDCVGRVRTIGSRRTPYSLSPEQRDLVRWLRQRGPSAAYVVEDMPKVDWLLERGGIPASHRLTRRDVPRRDLEHAVTFFGRFSRYRPPRFGSAALRAVEPVREPRLVVTAAEREDCVRWLEKKGWEGQPLILFQTQSRRQNRGRWPQERWVATLRHVLEELPEAWPMLIGAPAEAPQIEELRRACGDPRVREAARDLPLRRLFALAALAHSAISLDSGPAHVAAAFDCPVAVLAGRADPRRNRPVGPPGRVQVVAGFPAGEWPWSRATWECWHHVAKIEVAEVVDAWRRLRYRARLPVP